jgi:hypothetical protein
LADHVVDNLEEGRGKVSARVQEFEEFVNATQSARTLAEKCRDYVDGKQWDEAKAEVLRKRNQPVLTDNKIQDKVDALKGIERQNRSDPKAFPRNPTDEDTSEAATDALRYITEASVFDDTVQAAYENLLVEGFCAGEVIVDKVGKYPKICMNHIRYDRAYVDPYSLKLDYEDARYKGFSIWMDAAQAKEEYPGHEDEFEGSKTEYGQNDDAQGDKPVNPTYYTRVKGRNRVQIFTTYYKEKKKWMYAVWCRGGYLEGPKPSPYKDEEGQPDCPLEFQAMKRDRDGNAYGSVPRYLDTQDAINQRKSKIQHLLNTKQVSFEKGAISEPSKFRQELHKPDGMMERNPGFDLEVMTNLDLAATQFQVLQEDLQSMSLQGPNAALVGNTGQTSGRAKQIDQQAGQLPIIPGLESTKAWKIRMYRKAWMRVRQYWKRDMWIRVTDDEKKLKFVGLNQPMTVGEVIAKQLKMDPRPPEAKQEILQKLAQDPGSQEIARGEDGRPIIQNEVAKMDMDIILSDEPHSATVQQEQFQILASLAETRPEVPFAAVLKLSGLRSDTKKEVMDMLQNPNGAQQAQQAAEQAKAEMEAKEQQFADQQKAVDQQNQAVMAQKDMESAAKDLDIRKQLLDVEQQNMEKERQSISQEKEKALLQIRLEAEKAARQLQEREHAHALKEQAAAHERASFSQEMTHREQKAKSDVRPTA